MKNNTIFKALDHMAQMGRMSGHGLRTTTSTIPHRQAWRRTRVELQLVHFAGGDISAAQNYALSVESIANMTHWWSDYQSQRMTGETKIGIRKEAA